MGVTINYTDSNGDDFTHNRRAYRGGCDVATINGYLSAVRTVDAVDEPLELEELRSQLNLDPDDDTVIGNLQAWRKGGRQKLEQDTGLALLPQTWAITIDQFPSYLAPLRLPIWPILSIDSFAYTDRAGASHDLIVSPSTFVEAFTTRPATLALAPAATWPTDARQFQPGILTVRAGWPTPDKIPADLLMALRKVVADFAGFRESAMAIPGQAVQGAPHSYADLIEPWIVPGVA